MMIDELAKEDEVITRAMVRAGVGHLPAKYIYVCRELLRDVKESGSKELESALAYLEHMANQWKAGKSAKGHHLASEARLPLDHRHPSRCWAAGPG